MKTWRKDRITKDSTAVTKAKSMVFLRRVSFFLPLLLVTMSFGQEPAERSEDQKFTPEELEAGDALGN